MSPGVEVSGGCVGQDVGAAAVGESLDAFVTEHFDPLGKEGGVHVTQAKASGAVRTDGKHLVVVGYHQRLIAQVAKHARNPYLQ